jgi:quercetin dioxygenase-like cupin family protein
MGTALLSFHRHFPDTRLERSLWYMGALFTIHVDSSDTNGAFALFEVSGRPGLEPPLHMHRNEDELFYVLEGRVLVTRGHDQLVLEPGDSGFLPRMVPHTFRMLSEHARTLTYVTPGGFEDFFRTLGRPAERLTPDPNPPAPNFARIREVAAAFGITFVSQNSAP